MNKIYNINLVLPSSLHQSEDLNEKFIAKDWLNDAIVFTYPRPDDEAREIKFEDKDEPMAFCHYSFIADDKNDSENKVKLLEYVKKDAAKRIKSWLNELTQSLDNEIESLKKGK